MLSVRKMLVPIFALPGWIPGFCILIPLLVFLSPSWLPDPDPQYRLDDVIFTYQDNTAIPTGITEQRKRVSLPHDWRKSNVAIESGWYEFPLSFTEPVDNSTMLYITHVQQNADIWIDDIPVSSNVPEYVVEGHIWSRPVISKLPENVLTPGDHVMAIYIQSEPVTNGLLGNVYLGPAQKLRPFWEWRYHYRFTLVAIITFGMLCLSLFIGVLWLLRKKDTMYAWFTTCTFFWSMHNIPHIIDMPKNLTPAFWDALYFIFLGWMVMALVIFNHRYSGKTYPKRERFLLVYAVVALYLFSFFPRNPFINTLTWSGIYHSCLLAYT